MIDGIFINIAIVFLGAFATFIALKVKVDNLTQEVIGLGEKHKEISDRLEKHGDDIITLNTKSQLAMSAKDVDDKYVSKEFFKQFEKHIDNKFEILTNVFKEGLLDLKETINNSRR